MALISMAIHDLPENGRDKLTEQTLQNLAATVDFSKHRAFLIVNAATDLTRRAVSLFEAKTGATVIWEEKNIGTARAVNKGLAQRKPGEHCIKMDNDVVIQRAGWVDEMEEAINRDSGIGIIGLKRKDCIQHPYHPEVRYRSELNFVPARPIPGQKWIIVERTEDVMGTCTMFNSELLYKVGYLYQPNLYGFDDVLMCIRSQVAGFYNCFLHGYEIDHIDPGGDNYTAWKHREAGAASPEYQRLKAGYLSGDISIYYKADCTQ